MSIFSSLMYSGTSFYGDPFGPIIDTISDWGWSLLPQFPGSIRPSQGASPGPVFRPTQAAGLPPVPVAQKPEEWEIEAQTTWVPEVLSGSSGSGVPSVPRKVVVVDSVQTEVEEYEGGDFPAGSIFAPGRIWGSTAHDFDAPINEEQDVAFGDLLDWGIETLLGQQPWQGVQQFQQAFNPMGPAFTAASTTIPSGAPALPPSAAPLANGARMTGDNCGNRRYVTLDRETGKISCKRRRRRRLLTNRDLADLASLKTITGGGAALNAAVIRAVR